MHVDLICRPLCSRYAASCCSIHHGASDPAPGTLRTCACAPLLLDWMASRTLESNCDVVSSFPWLLGMRSAPDARCLWRFAVSPLWKVRTLALTSEHASEQLLACRPTSRLSPSNQTQDDVQNRDLRPSGHCWYASQAPLRCHRYIVWHVRRSIAAHDILALALWLCGCAARHEPIDLSLAGAH